MKTCDLQQQHTQVWPMQCEFLPDGTLTFVNRAYATYFGLPSDQLVGRSFLELIPEAARQQVRETFSSLTPENPRVIYQHQVLVGDEVRWQEWLDEAIFNEARELVCYRSEGVDITARKRSECHCEEQIGLLEQVKQLVRDEAVDAATCVAAIRRLLA